MDVDDDAAPEEPPSDYEAHDLTDTPVSGAGDLMAPVGELAVQEDPTRCRCRCDGVIAVSGTEQPVACEA
eukprot:3094693-Alexandrium_andersonii.AAC.1